MKNLTVRGTVKSDGSFLGGIAGNAKYAKIVNCHNYTDVTASGSKKEKIGGVVGQIGDYSDKSVLKNCSNHGNITGTDSENVGGVAGYTNYTEVSSCYNAGTVSAKGKVGGVIGNANGATVTDLYNVGSVAGQSGDIGGVIAYAAADVSNVYSAGQVTGGKAVFGKVGSSGSATNCYYLDTLPADSNAIAKTSADLKDLEGALNGDRTGEERAWKTSPSDNNGYPILFWQKTKSPVEDKPLAPCKECTLEI